MNGLVTVIIPVYNTEKYVADCIRSVIGQDYRELEIIAVNDGSTDGSLRVIKEWEAKDARIRVIDKENGGVSSARNLALDEAKGEYIVCVDSDDWLTEDAVGKLFCAIEKEKADIVACGIQQVWDGHTADCRICDRYECMGITEMGSRLLIDSVAFSSCNKMYRKSCIGSLRYPPIRVCEDAVFNRHVFTKAKRIVFLPDMLYRNRQRPGSATKQKIDESLVDEYLMAVEKMHKVRFSAYKGNGWDMSPRMLLFELTTAILLESNRQVLEYLVSWPKFYAYYRKARLGSVGANLKKTAVYALLRMKQFGLCMELARCHKGG